MTNIANQPEWAKAESARDILPALLAGCWIEKKEEDKNIVSQLAGKPYETFSAVLSAWMHKSDSPILKIGEWWRLVSPIDAWFALSPFLTEADLQTFKAVALEVLGFINPALELEPKKRWLASIYGKEMIYSGALRKGVAQTLVLIAVFGDDTGISASAHAQAHVDNIVRDLFRAADGKLWHSLSDVLSLIAEASPSSFLDAAELSLSKVDTPIMGMFSETEDLMSSSSAHPSLLWALEGLAWNPQLLGRVTLILGKLARLDPEGKLSNRPVNSLRNIFLLWLPHTYASLEQRLEAIDTLVEREPKIGWDLLVRLMPRYHDVCTPTHKTRWRQFSEKTDAEITITEHLDGIKSITSKLLLHVGNNGYRWEDVMENFSNLPPEDRSNIIQQLLSSAKEISDGRFELWSKLRSILSRHRSFPDADWALSGKELGELEYAYSLLQPEDTTRRLCWLFDEYRPSLPEGKGRDDYQALELIIAQRRLEAVREIRGRDGFQGLIKLVEHTNNPWQVGITVSEAGFCNEEEQTLLSLLEEVENNKASFTQSYMLQRALKEGVEWINGLVEKARSQQWQPNKIVNLFLALPQNRGVWELLESFDEAVQEAYWRRCALRYPNFTVEDKVYALDRLLWVNRYFTTVHYAALFAEEIPAMSIVQALQKAATESSLHDSHTLQSYDIQELFRVLDKSTEVKEEVMAHLEWLYLPVIAELCSARPPKMLHRELSKNPEFFVRVLAHAYKPEKENIDQGEEESLPQELLEQRARFAHKLLHSWRTPPGCDSNGQIEYEKLKAWVVDARKLCEKYDRREVGDSLIGQVLAHTGAQEKDMWPSEPVCRIIDEIQSNELDNGFRVRIYNKRGIVTKSPFEGGRQERELAERFRQYGDKWAIRYPRTASVLTEIAGSYENEARREDKEAETRDLEY